MKKEPLISFQLRKALAKKNGMVPIYCCLRYNNTRCVFNIKIDVFPSEWDGNNTRVIGPRKRELNLQLENIRISILRKYHELSKTNVHLTGKSIVIYYKNKSLIMNSIINVFKKHNNNMEKLLGKSFSFGSLKNYKTTLKRMVTFIKENYYENDLSLDKINYDFIQNFSQYILEKTSCNHNGMMKHMQRLKKIINICIKQRYINHNPFDGFSINFKRSNRVFLSNDELQSLTDIALRKSLSKIRDIFLCSCYTGLSYVDIKKLSRKNIRKGNDGFMWIFINREKTNIPSNIPLLPKAEEIILEYKNSHDNDLIFPVISNQKINRHLKEIATICGINKKLTFHSARHTFATTITLTNGMPIETVSKMLGHNNLRTTQIYAKFIDDKVSSDMKLLREKFL